MFGNQDDISMSIGDMGWGGDIISRTPILLLLMENISPTIWDV